jgi:hypothetical protein
MERRWLTRAVCDPRDSRRGSDGRSATAVERVGIFLYRGEFLRVGEQILRVHTTDVQRGLIYVY